MFKIKTMGHYCNHYLKTDVLLLADVFEKFIKTCLDYYRLDRCHYFSSPGLENLTVEKTLLMFSGGRERVHWEQIG